MKYVTLGRTGLKASIVSFGGIPIQRADAANTKAVVDKLEEYGINYIDTARGYTVSEEYLGAALEGRRDKFILATKSMARDKAGMARDIETSAPAISSSTSSTTCRRRTLRRYSAPAAPTRP